MSITFTDSAITRKMLDSLKKYKGKRVGVLFSGGLDSTALAVLLAKVGAEVTIIRGEVASTPNMRREVPVRDKIIELLRDNAPMQQTRTVNVSFGGRGPEHYLNGQMPYWMSVALLASCDLDYVTIAYVAGDEECSFIPEMSRAFKASQFNLNANMRVAKLEFPLHKFHKTYIVQALSGCEVGNLPILPMISYCEDRGGRSSFNGYMTPCGKCPSCQRMANKIGGFGEETLLRYSLDQLKAVWTGEDELVLVRLRTHTGVNGFVGSKSPDGKVKYLFCTKQAQYSYRESIPGSVSAWETVESLSFIDGLPLLMSWEDLDRESLIELGLGFAFEKYDAELAKRAKEAEIEANKKEEPCSEKQDSSEKNTEETTCLAMDTKA